jgi:hypothetical protein
MWLPQGLADLLDCRSFHCGNLRIVFCRGSEQIEERRGACPKQKEDSMFAELPILVPHVLFLTYAALVIGTIFRSTRQERKKPDESSSGSNVRPVGRFPWHRKRGPKEEAA